MGISVISSYRGGCNFETVGLSRTIVNEYFPGVLSKISGIGLTGIEKKLEKIIKMHLKIIQTFYLLEVFINLEKWRNTSVSRKINSFTSNSSH